jgi:tRNA threonylcarbamoyl adenosine modification protein YeaZ
MEADANQDHSKLLLPAIASLLDDEPLAAILVVIGPGAYAGIRVGIATAEGLALARGIPVYGIGTLEAVAIAAGFGDGVAIHPAGREQFAAQHWRAGQPDGKPAVAERDTPGSDCAGEGAAAFGGREFGPRERAEAALRDRAPAIRAGTLEAGAEAFYLREPSITVSRRREPASS